LGYYDVQLIPIALTPPPLFRSGRGAKNNSSSLFSQPKQEKGLGNEGKF